ncbi:hypothetical protein L2E82_11617 [Cichorium intybus]|uniref:Uncharacterized protein n=1 Tax=Cichorium intybus TaxID=13427 RepID=A0ACB9GDB1_CICIN|nr:hypothetical protein L2E82_11617 [Cichorium intybus]
MVEVLLIKTSRKFIAFNSKTLMFVQICPTKGFMMEAQICETGDAVVRESTLAVHACFRINSLSVREEHIHDVFVNLLSQLRERFPQILWKSSCLDSLLFSMNGYQKAMIPFSYFFYKTFFIL